MGEIKRPSPVLLITAVFSAAGDAFGWAKRKAESEFGPVALESPVFRVESFTDYYAPSMGGALPKQIWAFRNLIDPARLPKIKQLTNEWEGEYKRTQPCPAVRPLNLDPGYVDLGKLILASTKDHAHRIYLSDGIFAETTLIYTQKHWKALPWSYPDYQSGVVQDFLTECRKMLLKDAKSGLVFSESRCIMRD
ncbi:MAG: DUF4416 family protein [Planctomycetaceae bacterium]|jgi:hypothetical protein|nr:DUF4416 family protein [Planctomycetaceae bacterium]